MILCLLEIYFIVSSDFVSVKEKYISFIHEKINMKLSR